MVYLIDTNIIIRFLVGDHEKHLQISTKIFTKIENAEIEAEILDTVLMESLFVLVKFYKLSKAEVIQDLKRIIALQGIVGDKVLLIETLNIVNDKNIDFVIFGLPFVLYFYSISHKIYFCRFFRSDNDVS